MRKLLAAALIATGLFGQAAVAAPVQWTVASGGNDHYYEFFADAVSWQGARAAALTKTYQGMTGYLATLTSAAENRFASVTVAGNALAWIGATDEALEGTWAWSDGPEAGQALTYFNWAPSEPNNCCGGEDYVHTNWNGAATFWNDHGGPANANQVNGYLVEYLVNDNRVPEPASLALVAVAAAGLGVVRRRSR